MFITSFVNVGNVLYWGVTEPDYYLWKTHGQSCDWLLWLTCSGRASSRLERFPFSFCIHPNNGNPILCFLTYAYKMNWNSKQIVNWSDSKLACSLYSKPVANSNATTYPQNTIYVTDATSENSDSTHSSVSAYADYTNNIRASDFRRLYLNTQNVVHYVASSGRNYIIYAYCYPGKATRLYLGYACCDVVSNKYVRLRPKYEFRDKDDNTFGNFTDCSRIVSMDLKNGHLWITFMNGDSTRYYYFHILAKDLVGE